MTMHPKFLVSAATTAVVTAAAVSILTLAGPAMSSQSAPGASSTHEPQPQSLAAKGAACRITQSRSIPSAQLTNIRFINHHKGTVGVYWLNYQGNLVFYKTLTRNAQFVQASFRSNAWVVLNVSFNCVGYVVASGVHQYVIK